MLPLALPCGPPWAQGSWTLGLCTMFVCFVPPQSWIKTTTTVLYTSFVEDFVVDFVEILIGGVFDQTSLFTLHRLASRWVLLPIGPARPSAHMAGWPARTAIAL